MGQHKILQPVTTDLLDPFAPPTALGSPISARRPQIDPATAEVATLGIKLAATEAGIERARRLTRELRARYHGYVAAAEVLAHRRAQVDDPDHQRRLDASLALVTEQLTQREREIARADRRDQDVAVMMATLRRSVEMLTANLRAARGDLPEDAGPPNAGALAHPGPWPAGQIADTVGSVRAALGAINAAIDATPPRAGTVAMDHANADPPGGATLVRTINSSRRTSERLRAALTPENPPDQWPQHAA